jgi:indolepyruvate decarboxylase
VLVVDAGFPLIGSQGVPIVEANGFLAQAAWLSIGYSVPAATGVKCARPDKRVMVVVGDGAFHETCQAVSDQHAYGHNTVVFVLKNGLYGIEQFIVNPNPFREPPVQYSSKLENAMYPYNALASWEYDKVVEAFGGEGRKAQSVAQLQEILGEIRRRPEINFVVEVTIPEVSLPSALRAEVDTSVGEDEIDNPNWPPASKF